jgi:hypothetical protein
MLAALGIALPVTASCVYVLWGGQVWGGGGGGEGHPAQVAAKLRKGGARSGGHAVFEQHTQRTVERER